MLFLNVILTLWGCISHAFKLIATSLLEKNYKYKKKKQIKKALWSPAQSKLPFMKLGPNSNQLLV